MICLENQAMDLPERILAFMGELSDQRNESAVFGARKQLGDAHCVLGANASCPQQLSLPVHSGDQLAGEKTHIVRRQFRDVIEEGFDISGGTQQ
jgi:hypothetical protein